MGSLDEAMAHYVDNYDNNTTGKYEANVQEKGINMITFSSEQTAKLNELAASVREDWVKDNSGKFDAAELFDFTQKLYNQ